MEYRILGKTGLRVSVLALGGSPFGGVYGEMDESLALRTLRTALDAGINMIDTSPFYGLTRSETILGRLLQDVPRDRFYIATKLGRYGDAEFDFSAPRVMASIEESLTRLNVDVLDIAQAHDIEFGSLDQIVDETLPAMRRAQEQGKVRFIGVTGLPLKVFRYVLERAGVDVMLSYCRYTLFDTSLAGLLPYCESRAAGVISASPLSMGLLSEHGPPPWHPASEQIKQSCAEARAICRRHGARLSRIALQFAVDNSLIDSTVVGMASPEEVEANLLALDAPRNPELLAELQRNFAPIQNMTWPTGRPENQE